MKAFITAEQAIAILPEGETVHTFYNGPLMLVGADWQRSEVEDKIKKSDFRELTGPGAKGMHHGLCVYNEGATQGDILFIETDDAKLETLEAQLTAEKPQSKPCGRLFSTEQVSKYHPDKYADQISDAVLDACLRRDKNSRVACETMVKGNTVILAGEITTRAEINYAEIVTGVAKKLGYQVDNILTYIQTQSPEIAGGVGSGVDLGAGDQGMMYGYACRETESLLPFGFDLANRIIAAIEKDVETNPDTVFKGDAKCQVTVDLDEKPTMDSVKKILVSACHVEDTTLEAVQRSIHEILWDCGVDTKKVEVIANPAGTWTIGGPAADCGLTGRKIVCDQYGGYCPVGGGAFSGKDPSKVDRSGAYMARKIACDLLQQFEGIEWAEVQIAYAIGQSKPMSVNVKTNDPGIFDREAAKWITENYDLTPAGIITTLNLLNENYEKLAEGCHFRYGGWV